MPNARPKTVNTTQAARTLDVTHRTIHAWIKSGLLKASKPNDSGERQARWQVSRYSVERLKKQRGGGR